LIGSLDGVPDDHGQTIHAQMIPIWVGQGMGDQKPSVAAAQIEQTWSVAAKKSPTSQTAR
jgi:hypothetical protein